MPPSKNSLLTVSKEIVTEGKMRQQPDLKPLIWIGASRKDLREFPTKVQKDIGDALQKVQCGLKPSASKPLSGFGGASILEIRENYDGDTFRAVYTVRFAERIYVLHAFQKKSHHGIETAKRDIDLIRVRLQMAESLQRELSDSDQENN